MAREKRASEEIQQRALTAMLTDAFFTWPSAVNIAFSIIMFFLVPHLFIWWQPWFWLVFGVIAVSKERPRMTETPRLNRPGSRRITRLGDPLHRPAS